MDAITLPTGPRVAPAVERPAPTTPVATREGTTSTTGTAARKAPSKENEAATDPSTDGAAEAPVLPSAKKQSDPIFPVFLDPNVRLRVEYDKDAQQFVYLGVNVDSGEVVVQYPQEEVLRRLQATRTHVGLSVDTQA